ncbi:MAG: sigma-E processing peptidase SpoIIGA [Lachnospiraceae bacterium]|nr:sigma-E processing peptidase SpoIIGA [Lachnospiraceae bacterium]
MEYEFYLDIFFLTTFYLNFLSLSLTAACLNRKRSVVRFGIAAVLGSFWNSILVLYPFLPYEAELPITLLIIGTAMMMLSFSGLYTEGILRILQADGCLFLSAGLVNGCYSFSCQQFYLTDPESLICTGLISILMEQLIRKSMSNRRSIGCIRYDVILTYRGKEKHFIGLADSGNRLCVPGTGKPVSLISANECKDFCENVSEGFYIPYRAVGTEKGTLFAMRFERMRIMQDGKTKIIDAPVVAIVKEPLSVKGDFSMILPEAYIPEE